MCTRACFIDVGSGGSLSLVAAGASAIAVAKQRASVADMCGLCIAIATASLYNSLRVRLPCRILRLSTDAKISRCRGALRCRRGGDARASATACRLLSVLSSIALSKLKLLLLSSLLNSKPLPSSSSLVLTSIPSSPSGCWDAPPPDS
jgi:hypothetical protein